MKCVHKDKSAHIPSLVIVALGGNQSRGETSVVQTIKDAVKAMTLAGAVIRSQSRLYRTAAVPQGSGPDFVNGALALNWPAPVSEILRTLHQIERQMGRIRKTRWAPRTIDLDLIAADDMVCPDINTYQYWHTLPVEAQAQHACDELILPHPRMHERGFVLVPLAEVAPDWVHPILNLSVQQMRDALDPRSLTQIIAIE